MGIDGGSTEVEWRRRVCDFGGGEPLFSPRLMKLESGGGLHSVLDVIRASRLLASRADQAY